MAEFKSKCKDCIHRGFIPAMDFLGKGFSFCLSPIGKTSNGRRRLIGDAWKKCQGEHYKTNE